MNRNASTGQLRPQTQGVLSGIPLRTTGNILRINEDINELEDTNPYLVKQQ